LGGGGVLWWCFVVVFCVAIEIESKKSLREKSF